MFRRMIKWIGWTVLGFGGLIAMGLLFVLIRFPREIPVEDLVIEPSPERVERGRYLVNNVAFCMNCHAERDWGSMSGQIVPGTEGKGAMQNIFGDGPVYAANITPHALGDWSDGQIKRALTSGLNAEAKPLHPNMPYFTYADMSEEDVHAVVAYLRTLKPIEHDPPRAAPSPLISLVARILPKPYTPKPPPNPEDSVAVGRYLTQLAGCQDCHRSDFSGGQVLYFPDGATVQSMNLTPTPNTRIGDWSREDFIGVFKSFSDEQTRSMRVAEAGMNSVMPWVQYSDMTESDLGAIYDYLRTFPPVPEKKAKKP